MTSATPVEPPILSESSPDRPANCEVAIEPAFQALVGMAVAQDWKPLEIAETLVRLANAYLDELQQAGIQADEAALKAVATAAA